MQLPTKYGTGCKSMDELLGGGFESGTVTQLYGEAGSGKTNICLQMAIECARDGQSVIFIDSEGLSPERFSQIASAHKNEDETVETLAERIILYQPHTFEQQTSCVKEIDKIIKEKAGKSAVQLIVLDSATLFYRLELDDERSAYVKSLANQVATLLEYARRHDLVVIITNQVYMDVETGELRPVAKFALEYLAKVIVQLEKVPGMQGKRRAILKKHRSMPEETVCTFYITQSGIADSPERVGSVRE
ncbi:MAG TPA: DNA repair and recombination protein RadB [Methanomicrobia archaeon]|nr:DNA repair and recombination protein RadB [Methanomicrobia archaeon]